MSSITIHTLNRLSTVLLWLGNTYAAMRRPKIVQITLNLEFNMDNLKYRITNETIRIGGRTLYQIQALKDFSDVKAGDLGGYVESIDNLSQEGDCWVYYIAWVFDNAKVFGNAQVYGNAVIYNNAKVCGNAMVFDKAKVFGNAEISDNARVYGDAWISDNARVHDRAIVRGKARMTGNAMINGNARLYN